MAIND
jgi:protein KRI1